MMQFLEWYGQHPWLGTFIVLIIATLIGHTLDVLLRRTKS